MADARGVAPAPPTEDAIRRFWPKDGSTSHPYALVSHAIAASHVHALLSALSAARERADQAEQAAYEQAAKWCEERAEKMLGNHEKHGRPDPSHAGWVMGCADTIRFNANSLRALASASPDPEASST